jgi:subtilisin family serine protease
MRTYILFLCFICSFCIGFSQNHASNFSGRSNDQQRDPRADRMNFVPNQILIKFKDSLTVTNGSRIKAVGVNSVDRILQAHGVTSLEKLFPAVQKPVRIRMMKSPQGKDISIPRIDNIYKVSIPEPTLKDSIPTNIFQVIEELKALSEVEYVEPNYIYSIDNMQPNGPVLTADDVQKLRASHAKASMNSFEPNDPLYSQQWYIPAVKADSVWQQTTGDSTQVIAILDTGVDWNHPDLKNKIWINPKPNITPDVNGVVNDIRGWDYINNDNNPMDDNSHGTHVAGIAAAETNNGIGIAGVCPNAKIMPVKVFQSSGQGDAATIAKGINYAATHGATVINMSFGSYSRSLAMEDALVNAYATCVLVAAAGNDNFPIGPGKSTQCNEKNPGSPFYPAALSYVLGVQAPEACFSNYDPDGSTFSAYTDLLNYEMKAPGTNILSTVPNGNYRIYQGTSMASPIVAGIAALYRSMRPDESQELLFGNLINSISTYVDIQKALSVVPVPQLAVVTYSIADTLDGNKNGLPDAGETIDIKVTVRNTWGLATDVKVGIAFKEYEDTISATIITPETSAGSISTYATQSNILPLRLKLSRNIADGRSIGFILKTWYGDHLGMISQPIVINVENGTELSGVVDTILTLTPDKQWLVNSSFKIGKNGILILKPGTKLTNKKGIVIFGKVEGLGTPDSMIVITGPGGFVGGYYGMNCSCNFSNSIFKDLNQGFQIDSISFNKCQFENTSSDYLFCSSNLTLKENHFTGINASLLVWGGCKIMDRNSIVDSHLLGSSSYGTDFGPSTYDVFKYNNFSDIDGYIYQSGIKLLFGCNSNFDGNKIGNNYIGFNQVRNIYNVSGTSSIIKIPYQYWGSTDKNKIKLMNWDFWNNSLLPIIDYDPILSAPSDSAHAIVWKVLVNGKDAQDEAVDPVGVGKQRFDVYFNRPMDKSVVPELSFGVRYPYNQQSANENGSWSTDGLIYTAFKTIKLTTGDGINRIRVASAKETNGWNFEIPVEDMRFNFVISAASSSSLDFMATPGLGKVKLEWNNNNLEDGLGYNMYRMENINDSTLTTPTLINSALITDTLYTDFTVIPNKKYYYYYKIVRTDLSETDSSKVVSATPLTAVKGDANGDLSVNVLDITSIIAYLLNNNPQPFISEAADFNSDGSINVLDIVGVVNKILNVPQGAPTISLTKQVDLYLQNDTLYANSNTDIGGIQLDIKGINSIEDIKILNTLNGFESGNSLRSDSLRLIFYSMSGKSIPAGQGIPLLKLRNGSTIVSAIFGETNGSAINVNYILTRIGDVSNNMNQTLAELGQNYPNPVNGKTIIPVRIYEPADEVLLRIVNMMGQEIDLIRLANPYIGEHLLEWSSGQNKGLFVYTLEIINDKQRSVCPVKKMIVQ